ncbi:MAG TPA: hydroxymethylglutaryl-CoA reductase, degradative [Euryarchaeota archaeon]|nr:hydroxymethylglutaryl-CoA reductase, degradative [Euryarchaeota archaeon]
MTERPLESFYKVEMGKRREIIGTWAGLDRAELDMLNKGGLDERTAENMVENVIGIFSLPLGIATNIVLNGQEIAVPMVTEETSVIAAASNAGKMCMETGGVRAQVQESLTIGQIYIDGLTDYQDAISQIEKNKTRLLDIANSQDEYLIKLGGGARDIESRVTELDDTLILRVHILVDTKDAMGANVVNTMSEAISKKLEQITSGNAVLCIVSNLSDRRLVRATASWNEETLGVDVEKIIKVWNIAKSDPYRCATHNKGVMNGMTAVAIATGNDTRALEAAAHSYSFRDGKPCPLTKYRSDEKGVLYGEITVPFPLGVFGGATTVHPLARVNRKILKVETAKELGEVMAAVGLLQNLAALRALSKEGIQKGHMRLHAKNTAISAGAVGDEVERVASLLTNMKKFDTDTAKNIIAKLRGR